MLHPLLITLVTCIITGYTFNLVIRSKTDQFDFVGRYIRPLARFARPREPEGGPRIFEPDGDLDDQIEVSNRVP